VAVCPSWEPRLLPRLLVDACSKRAQSVALKPQCDNAVKPSPSQCSLHNAPIFRLLLKVAVNGTHQCESLNFCGDLCPNNQLTTCRLLFPCLSFCLSVSAFLCVRFIFSFVCFSGGFFCRCAGGGRLVLRRWCIRSGSLVFLARVPLPPGRWPVVVPLGQQ